MSSGSNAEYRFYTEFQSHEAEFDYLKSLEIEEKINQIAWCQPSAGSLFLLSTNDKTIKLWKIFEKQMKMVQSMNVEHGRYGGPVPVKSLRLPVLTPTERAICAHPRRVFANAHAYHINSIAVCSDGMSYLSSDDLRINLWSLDNHKSCFNIVDMKPDNMDELAEVITVANFHPSECHVFAYSTSRGSIKLADMRASALCDRHSKLFEVEEDLTKSYFSEVIASISDIKFTRDGTRIVSRDYLTVKVWDVRSEARPLQTIPLHDYLRPSLPDLYENDCIFDKFEVGVNGAGTAIMTGTYQNRYLMYDTAGETETFVELSKVRPRPGVTRPLGAAAPPDLDSIDFSKKVLHFAWHPCLNIVAVAGLNNLYIYTSP